MGNGILGLTKNQQAPPFLHDGKALLMRKGIRHFLPLFPLPKRQIALGKIFPARNPRKQEQLGSCFRMTRRW